MSYKKDIRKKILASVYGLLGHDKFKLYNPDICNEITKDGRKIIRTVVAYLRKTEHVVIAVQTDGVYYMCPNRTASLTNIDSINQLINTMYHKGKDAIFEFTEDKHYDYLLINGTYIIGREVGSKKLVLKGFSRKTNEDFKYLEIVENVFKKLFSYYDLDKENALNMIYNDILLDKSLNKGKLFSNKPEFKNLLYSSLEYMFPLSNKINIYINEIFTDKTSSSLKNKSISQLVKSKNLYK